MGLTSFAPRLVTLAGILRSVGLLGRLASDPLSFLPSVFFPSSRSSAGCRAHECKFNLWATPTEPLSRSTRTRAGAERGLVDFAKTALFRSLFSLAFLPFAASLLSASPAHLCSPARNRGKGAVNMAMQSDDAKLERAAELVRKAERLVVFTGAGMSADSGISTFRKAGSGGLWEGIK
jgi:hypothetical protein